MRKNDLIPTGASIPKAHPAEDIGRNLKALRQARGMSLTASAARCSVSAATLSRIENGLLSPTYDVISKICEGFEIGIRDLIGYGDRVALSGWTSATRAGAGRIVETPHYRFELLCDEILAKPFLVFRADILCRSMAEFGALQSHAGQEQIVVQSGRVEVWIEQYKPRLLDAGDSLAFDSRLGHAVISVGGDTPARVLWICDSQEVR
ncbi:helix-turn-helix domain-containing protein [Celeribacter neptunius]|uniref:Transcriptional regulator, XRE family with cupin sensor n=1 Tax=Celeribacter neptunius TaxID=588602 RepID=A0A1I3PP84_9RHOB|nr:XRE family transcriptional regulator [Celeribacter neptunius]SFJ23117.1 transcriptional regulator, XRE family with cupin sensor [Celeribacter neptunius]